MECPKCGRLDVVGYVVERCRGYGALKGFTSILRTVYYHARRPGRRAKLCTLRGVSR